MKTKKTLALDVNEDSDLILMTQILCDCNLMDPQVETTARFVLNALRKKGYFSESSDLEDPDCLSCLYLALTSASQIIPKNLNL